jgi:hypothetical protein
MIHNHPAQGLNITIYYLHVDNATCWRCGILRPRGHITTAPLAFQTAVAPATLRKRTCIKTVPQHSPRPPFPELL